MDDHILIEIALEHLNSLCNTHPHRQVGSVGNRAATDYFARVSREYGFTVEEPQFDCLDWKSGARRLAAGGEEFDFVISNYSLGCEVTAPLVVVSTLAELEAVEATGKVLLVQGELAVEQLMPKNFTYYNPDSHKQIIALLEQKAPLAIIAATGHNPELAGAIYPFPLIEDGDFNLPVANIKDVDGERLASHSGETIELSMEAQRIPTRCTQVLACKGADPHARLVFSAHIDTKATTPGALDNATGAIVLLLLAELLQDYNGRRTVELVPFNGEDHYSVAGQKLYMERNDGRLGEISLNVNLDGLGWLGSPTAYSFYACKDEITTKVREVFGKYPELVEGSPWPQGDHMIFAMSGVPAVAITTEKFTDLEHDIAHTEKDVPGLVDPVKLVATAKALHELVTKMEK